VAGLLRWRAGELFLDGLDLATVPPYLMCGHGIALVPEGRRLFPDMTLEENLLVAGRRARPGQWNVETVLEAFPLLRPLRGRRAATLSGGEQQAAAIGRALMTNPRVLLLDEVSLGLAPVAVQAVYESIAALISGGATILLVEQDLARAIRVADRVLCMLEGSVVLEGSAADLSREQITEAYFGLRRGAGAAGAP
jgi:branched-chain amino acid transport system ATP-binding protein